MTSKCGQHHINQIVLKYKTFIFDCDGVLYKSKGAIDHAFDFLHQLKKKDKQILFLTNNSLFKRSEVGHKLKSFGNFDTEDEKIYTSCYLAADYLKTYYPTKTKVYAIGRPVLIEELRSKGFEVIDSAIHNSKYGAVKFDEEDVKMLKEIEAVVVGFDEYLNYYKMSFASVAIQNGAVFIATNSDRSTGLMKVGDFSSAGTGCFVQAIEAACNKKAIITGKPNVASLELIIKHHNFAKPDSVFIGDDLYSDIKFSNNAGIDSLLVLTGTTSHEMFLNTQEKAHEECGKPTYVFENLRYEEEAGKGGQKGQEGARMSSKE